MEEEHLSRLDSSSYPRDVRGALATLLAVSCKRMRNTPGMQAPESVDHNNAFYRALVSQVLMALRITDVDEKKRVMDVLLSDDDNLECARSCASQLDEDKRPVAFAAVLCACVSGQTNHGAGMNDDGETRELLLKRNYDARARLALQELAHILKITDGQMASAECALAGLTREKPRSATDEEMSTASTEDSFSLARMKRLAIVGSSAVLAGAAFAATAGVLVAPTLAAGLASISGAITAAAPASHAAAVAASAAAAAGSSAGTAAVSGAAAAYGGSVAGFRTSNLVDDVDHFQFVRVHNVVRLDGARFARLAVTVGVVGWLPFNASQDDIKLAFRKPFETARHDDSEVVALEWESEELATLSNSLWKFARSQVFSQVIQEVGTHTVLAGVVSAAALPSSMASALGVIDNPMHLVMNRSIEAGRLLAKSLANGVHGDRPVTFVAFGMGARLVFQALLELGRLPNDDGLGIVQNVLLVGAMVDTNTEKWNIARRVTAGRLVNAYSKEDVTLSLGYRTASVTTSVAGLKGIRDVKGVENVDLTRFVADAMSTAGFGSEWLSQSAYARLMPEIMDLTGFSASSLSSSPVCM
mmetsp:Transcript_11689/g.29527  ORF Transcript_11689/g.29527 Transcript_11689/m.29527 type:complete len:587 (-) Transcript_11689:37-1797(-)